MDGTSVAGYWRDDDGNTAVNRTTGYFARYDKQKFRSCEWCLNIVQTYTKRSSDRNKRKSWRNRSILEKRAWCKVGIMDNIFKKNRNMCQKKFYELTYIIEDNQQKRLSELAERFKMINGWSEKKMLQFAVTATNQADIEMKLNFLECIIADLEKGQLDK